MSNAELSSCVVINIENMAKIMPSIVAHPMYQIALSQAKELEAALMKDKEADRILAVIQPCAECGGDIEAHHCPKDRFGGEHRVKALEEVAAAANALALWAGWKPCEHTADCGTPEHRLVAALDRLAAKEAKP